MELLETLSAGAPTPLTALFIVELKSSVAAAWPSADAPAAAVSATPCSSIFLGARMIALLSCALDAAAAAPDAAALIDSADAAVAALNLYRFILLREIARAPPALP